MRATIGIVMINAIPRKMTAGASILSSDVLVPSSCRMPSAGIPRTTMPTIIAASISR